LASHSHAETLALREQFNTEAQQKDASTLGMWIFLITEIMFFGGLFLAYTVYRRWYADIFAVASCSLDVYIGAANTVVLCVSVDLPFAAGRFCAAEGLDNVVPASAWRNPEFGQGYGVTLVDGPLRGLLARAVVVLDVAGKVLHTELVPEIAQEPDYKAALAVLA